MTEPEPQAHGFSRGSRLRRAEARIVAPGWDDGAVRYHSTNRTAYSAKYHLIWCSKCRRRVLVDGVDQRMKGIIGDVALRLAPRSSRSR
jgi:Transposase IS200 like